MENLSKAEREELERFREKKKKISKYNADYSKEKYRRIICLYPKDKAHLFDQARGDLPASAYLIELINRDLKEKGLLTDQPE